MPITVRPMPPQLPPHVVDKLARCETATIGHFEDETFMGSEIRAMMPGARVAGTAVTLRMPHVDAVLMAYCLSFVRPGDVVVIDRCGDGKHACWGGVVGVAARCAGVAGVIIGGPTTDLSEQRATGVPNWSTGTAPITARRLGLSGSLNVPVSCGGIAVNPGDAVLADESGVFVCAPGRAEAIADEALRRQANEPTVLARLRAGERFGDVMGVIELVDRTLREQGDEPLT